MLTKEIAYRIFGALIPYNNHLEADAAMSRFLLSQKHAPINAALFKWALYGRNNGINSKPEFHY
jgi:hypothetical protein